MSRLLVAALIVAQVTDLGTYLLAPHMESNPVMAALPPAGAVVAKLVAVWAILVIASRIRTRWLGELALVIPIAVGAFGAGANVASLVGAGVLG